MEGIKKKQCFTVSHSVEVACDSPVIVENQLQGRVKSSEILSAQRGCAPKYEKMMAKADRLVKIFEK